MTDPPQALGDLHSHLIPGVDDGARTVDDALDGLGRMMAVGVTRVATTPHALGSLTRDPDGFAEWIDHVDTQWEALERAATASYPGLELHRGHEVMLDVPDPDLSDPRLRLGDTAYALIEWPRLQIPPGTVPVLTRLVAAGVKPLIAHPERYAGLDRGLGLVEEWKRVGAGLQCNYGSLLGRYGPAPRTVALRMLERGLVDCLSTDFHGRRHLKLFVREARELFEDVDGEEAWSILSGANPRRILDDEAPLAVPPIDVGTSLWGRVRDLFRGV